MFSFQSHIPSHLQNGNPSKLIWKKVAELAGQHAAALWVSILGRLVGLWHDLGNFSPDFQAYIRQANEAHWRASQARVNHSSAGALLAIERFGKIGRILAYCIMGHHAGLPDWQSEYFTTGISCMATGANGIAFNGKKRVTCLRVIMEQHSPIEKKRKTALDFHVHSRCVCVFLPRRCRFSLIPRPSWTQIKARQRLGYPTLSRTGAVV
jgi:CRISPR-associated endonuclease Cas3-HD